MLRKTIEQAKRIPDEARIRYHVSLELIVKGIIKQYYYNDHARSLQILRRQANPLANKNKWQEFQDMVSDSAHSVHKSLAHKLENSSSQIVRVDPELYKEERKTSLLRGEEKGASHIKLEDGKYSDPSLRGLLVFPNKETRKLEPCSSSLQEHILKHGIIGVGGVDFDEPAAFGAMGRELSRLFGVKREDIAFLYPHASRQKRFEDATDYTVKSNFITPPGLVEFAKSTIYPYLVEGDSVLEGLQPNKMVRFASFSIGGRELMMIDNALVKIAAQEKLNFEQAHLLFAHIRGVALAAALPVQPLPYYFSSKLIIFSDSDTGVKRPYHVLEEINSGKSIFEYKSEFSEDVMIKCFLPYLLEEDAKGKAYHPNNHSITQYVETLLQSSELFRDNPEFLYEEGSLVDIMRGFMGLAPQIYGEEVA